MRKESMKISELLERKSEVTCLENIQKAVQALAAALISDGSIEVDPSTTRLSPQEVTLGLRMTIIDPSCGSVTKWSVWTE
jgi:hypothetical protein